MTPADNSRSPAHTMVRAYCAGCSEPPTGEEGPPLPERSGNIKYAEYTFNAVGLKAGRNRVLVENIGREPHFLVAAPIKPGKTIADVREFGRNEEGEPPILEEKATLDGGDRRRRQAAGQARPGEGELCPAVLQPRSGGGPASRGQGDGLGGSRPLTQGYASGEELTTRGARLAQGWVTAREPRAGVEPYRLAAGLLASHQQISAAGPLPSGLGARSSAG